MLLTRATFRSRPSSRQLLARVLDTPDLPQRVQSLSGPALGKLIARVGLEDAGELVALASTEQLAQIFDEDLWSSARPGVDERFDAARFLLWLEVMFEAGERFVAERLSELPQDLLTLAIHRHVLVLPLDDLQRELTAGDDQAESAEKAFESCYSEELDDYQLIWRGGEGWDSVWSALLALDRDHHSLLVDLLERCAMLGRGQIDDNGGLYTVLSSEEMLETDLQADREERRAAQGYVAPSAAQAFLRLAALGESETPFREHDPMTLAYFRNLSPAGAQPARVPGGAGQLLAGAAAQQAAQPLLIRALRRLEQADPATFATRSEELAYLSNVLLAGHSVAGRRLRPYDAVQLAIATVSRGLELAEDRTPRDPLAAATRRLRLYPCDGLFRLAWSRPL
jgi:hypothetical protein